MEKEKYYSLITKEERREISKSWKFWIADKEEDYKISFAHNIFYHIVRNTDFKTAIAKNTNPYMLYYALDDIDTMCRSKRLFDKFTKRINIDYDVFKSIVHNNTEFKEMLVSMRKYLFG